MVFWIDVLTLGVGVALDLALGFFFGALSHDGGWNGPWCSRSGDGGGGGGITSDGAFARVPMNKENTYIAGRNCRAGGGISMFAPCVYP